jgi:hypothetical protein
MKNTRSIPSELPQAMAQELAVLVRSALMGALEQGRLGLPNTLPPLLVEPAASPIAPAQMAEGRSGDTAVREQMAATYAICLRTYRDIARTHGDGADVDDLGAAMAFFVAINLRALHGVDVESDALRPLERQLRSVTRLAAQWDSATLPQRQLFFERIAITSILMARALGDAASQGLAAAADVRRRARDYLQHLLGLDPDLVSLGADGLVLRDKAIGTEAAAMRH